MSKWAPDDFKVPAKVIVQHMNLFQEKARRQEPITVDDIKALFADVTNAHEEAVEEAVCDEENTYELSGSVITIPITHCASTWG